MLLKETIKKYVPPFLVQNAKAKVQRLKLRYSGTMRAFSNSDIGPEWLGFDEIKALDQEFSAQQPSLVAERYIDDALISRAEERRQMIKQILGKNYASCQSFIETGAADAMVALSLQRDGKNVVATDIQDSVVNDIARKEKVPFELWSATTLEAPDNSYDVLYSFDSLEHFDDPEAALNESIRVVKPGGFVYLRFGPLYWSPQGMHLGSRLGVPYASVLFPKETIDNMMKHSGMDVINHEYCNGWSLSQYRNLFDKYRSEIKKREYYEHWDLSGLELIRRYPHCFRSKSDNIEEFLVSVIDVLFQKK